MERRRNMVSASKTRLRRLLTCAAAVCMLLGMASAAGLAGETSGPAAADGGIAEAEGNVIISRDAPAPTAWPDEISDHPAATEGDGTAPGDTGPASFYWGGTEAGDARIRAEAGGIMSGMTDGRKAGQLFLVMPSGDLAGIAAEDAPGGFILMGSAFSGSTPEAVRSRITAAQEASEIPLIISTDEEGGLVARVSGNGGAAFRTEGRFLSPQELLEKAGGDRTAALSLVAEQAAEMAGLLAGLGINMNHAPVADTVATGKQDANAGAEGASPDYRTPSFDDAYMGGTAAKSARAWGGTVEETAAYAAAAASAMEGHPAPFGTTLKHFPSYGNAHGNGHDEIIVYSEEEYSLEDVYGMMIPFAAGIEAGGEALMITHNVYEAFDAENSMSMSSKLYDHLRNVLGFDGLAMTDGLAMSGIVVGGKDKTESQITQRDTILAAIAAGADMVITSDTDAIEAVAAKMAEDPAFGERVEESCLRVLCWKLSHGLFDHADAAAP